MRVIAIVCAVAGVLGIAAAASPARADWHGHDGWRHHGWHRDGWRERDWRWHHRHRFLPRVGYGYGPRGRYYHPYGPAPGVTIGVRIP